MIKIRVLIAESGAIHLAGTLPRVPAGKDYAVRICNEKKEDIGPEIFPMPYSDKKDENGNVTAKARGFRVSLPLYAGAKYRFVLDWQKEAGSVKSKAQEIRFGSHSALQNIENSYVDTGGEIIKCINNEIRVYEATWKMRLACRYRLEKTLKNEGKSYLIPLRRRALRSRSKARPVVIISDRVSRGGDNGEALFRYLMANGYDRDHDIYFAVMKESPDYERLKEVGKVLDFGSDEYKEKFLIADKIISAGFDKWFSNAFGDDYKYMIDLYRFRHYFLQHGVIMNDLSKSLNYTLRAFRLFCTTTEPERESILGETYAYHEDEVRLTGLARYDLLEDEAEKLIVIAPTWRIDLAGPIDEARGARFYSDLIPESEYCRFYNALINNDRLTASMKDHGYRGEFYLHPSFIENTGDFTGNDTIEVCGPADYNRIFRKAAVLVTDYSSVNIDFAYLNKPVIYSQFDRDEFFEKHLCGAGYFDYARDGFGPVLTTVYEVADEIIRLMENGCVNSEEYAARADKFFFYRDRNNCERIAEAIFGEN